VVIAGQVWATYGTRQNIFFDFVVIAGQERAEYGTRQNNFLIFPCMPNRLGFFTGVCGYLRLFTGQFGATTGGIYGAFMGHSRAIKGNNEGSTGVLRGVYGASTGRGRTLSDYSYYGKSTGNFYRHLRGICDYARGKHGHYCAFTGRSY
jgi:hypothetical protein